ncbi:MAG: hypothetical protein M3342_07635, partial [Bacteroidota bacterium]|nr:hypothetical protein [Bacteroidota bacterium]
TTLIMRKAGRREIKLNQFFFRKANFLVLETSISINNKHSPNKEADHFRYRYYTSIRVVW